MDHFLLIVIFFIFLILTNAEIENDTSVTNKPWFWPLLGISLALLLSIPSTLIILVFICYNKNKSNNDSDESNIHSNSSISERRHRNPRHMEGFPSPPPPYTTCERPENLFMTPSLPPPYESHVNENSSTEINIPPPPNTSLDLSSTLTNPSIQTFQA